MILRWSLLFYIVKDLIYSSYSGEKYLYGRDFHLLREKLHFAIYKYYLYDIYLPYNIRLKNSEYDENGILVKKYDNISIMEKDILIEPSR